MQAPLWEVQCHIFYIVMDSFKLVDKINFVHMYRSLNWSNFVISKEYCLIYDNIIDLWYKYFNFAIKMHTPSSLFKSFTWIYEHVFLILSSKEKKNPGPCFFLSRSVRYYQISVSWSHSSKSSMFFKLGGTNNFSLAVTMLSYQ